MNTQELLKELSEKVARGEISRSDVLAHIKSDVQGEGGTHSALTKILYTLGGIVVLIGVLIFVAQIWDDIGSIGRIAITLGLGLLIAGNASVLLQKKPESKLGMIFHGIAGLIMPWGVTVTLLEMNVTDAGPFALGFVVLTAFYLLLMKAHKHAILTFFAIMNATIAVYLAIPALLFADNIPYSVMNDIYMYTTMVLGVSYILLAHAFRGSWNSLLTSILYFFGSFGFLAAGFSRIEDSIIWQLLYLVFVLGGLALAAYVRSRGVLIVTTLALIGYVIFITSEYFADSLGWPVSLVLLGFAFIGLGYLSITINKKYIAKKDGN